MKTVNLGGVEFEVKDSRKYPVTIDSVNDYMQRFTGKDLDSFYGRCSETKKAIWRQWQVWKHENPNASHMQVSSANGWRFTIDCLWFGDDDIIEYMLHITSDHNYAYVVHHN